MTEYGKNMFSFIRNCQSLLSGCTILHSHQVLQSSPAFGIASVLDFWTL